jgi:two-component system, sensor histidine kinase PdtaS
VPHTYKPPRLNEYFPLRVSHPVFAYAGALLLVALAFLARLGALPWLPQGYQFVTFFPAVILASFLVGARVGFFAAVLCGLLAWYFFIAPVESWQINFSTLMGLGFYSFTVGIDIALVHWMQRANRALMYEREVNAQLAETRALLFSELQHRVSNNLQVVAGLLTLQKRRVADSTARAALDEASRRLGVIGRISRQLYDSEGKGSDLAPFLNQLAKDVIDASGRPDITYSVACAGGLTIAPERAVPMALIVAESLANAIEHGFATKPGRIEIVVGKHDGGLYAIEVRDDGGALPDGFDSGAQESLGLRIATTLARQIGGDFTLTGGARTVARLEVPVDVEEG